MVNSSSEWQIEQPQTTCKIHSGGLYLEFARINEGGKNRKQSPLIHFNVAATLAQWGCQ